MCFILFSVICGPFLKCWDVHICSSCFLCLFLNKCNFMCSFEGDVYLSKTYTMHNTHSVFPIVCFSYSKHYPKSYFCNLTVICLCQSKMWCCCIHWIKIHWKCFDDTKRSVVWGWICLDIFCHLSILGECKCIETEHNIS